MSTVTVGSPTDIRREPFQDRPTNDIRTQCPAGQNVPQYPTQYPAGQYVPPSPTHYPAGQYMPQSPPAVPLGPSGLYPTLGPALAAPTLPNVAQQQMNTPLGPTAPPVPKAKRKKWKRPKCRCIPACFCVVNVIIFIMGIAILALGVVAHTDVGPVKPLKELIRPLTSAAIVLMITGGVVVFLGLVGCCGVLLRNRVMVATVGGVFLLLVLAQVVGAILTYVYWVTVKGFVETSLTSALTANYDGMANSSNSISRAVDLMQSTLGCCGVKNASDFLSTKWFEHRSSSSLIVPVSCCKLADRMNMKPVNEKCPYTNPGKNNPNTGSPCFEAAMAFISDQRLIVAITVAILLAAEIIFVCTACLVIRDINKQNKNEQKM